MNTIKRHRLITTLSVFLGLTSLVWWGLKPAYAANECQLSECLGGEDSHIRQTICQEGTVATCTDGNNYKCQRGSWSQTSESPSTSSQCSYVGQMPTSFDQSPEQFNRVVVQALQTKEESRETFVFGLVNNIANALDIGLSSANNVTGYLNAALLTTPPLSSREYFAYLGNKVGITKPVYAQGIGFSGLSPIIHLWQLFRNIAYVFFILVFAIVGIMIILRRRIDPRTVVTIQDSLPRFVVVLILITFSYALAGLMVDLGDLSIRLTGNILGREGYIANPINPASAPKSAFPDQARLNNLFSSNVFRLASIEGLGNTENLKTRIRQSDLPVVNFPGIGTIFVWVVFDWTLFFIGWRIFFSLLSPYVTIVLWVILGPLFLVLAAIPGSGASQVGNWFKKLIANIAVFPGVFIVLAIAAILKSGAAAMSNSVWYTNQANEISGLWSPAVIGQWGSAVGDLLALGILLGIPKLADEIKNTLQLRGGPMEEETMRGVSRGLSRVPFVGGLAGGQG